MAKSQIEQHLLLHEFRLLLGGYVIATASTESLFLALLQLALRDPSDATPAIWLQFTSTRARLEMVRNVHRSRFPGTPLTENVCSFIKTFRGLTRQRNFYCHAVYFPANDGGCRIGANRPTGFLQYDQVAESAWEWGKLGYVATGVAGELPADAPSDVLIDTVYALKAGYRQNASWVMNRRTQAAIRKLKDEDGNYLWQPPAMPGGRAMLMGFGLVEAEDMPDIATDAAPIAFGDFRRGYLVVDRAGVRVLRDPYSAKPYVLFYTTKRVGGGVQDFDAIKLLKFGVS